LHGDAVEAVGGFHGALLVADNDELCLVAELVDQAQEAVQVHVVERVAGGITAGASCRLSWHDIVRRPWIARAVLSNST